MDSRILLFLSCMVVATAAWSRPIYPVPRRPMRFTRFAPPPPLQLRQHPHLQQRALLQAHAVKLPVESADLQEPQWDRPKRGHHDDYDHDHDFDHDHSRDHDHDHGRGHGHKATSGVTGPVHTFVKTDKNANYKWGVRHHVGDKYAP